MYEDFIRDKIKLDSRMGFAIEDSQINPMLFPHQRDIVRWALRGGRRAIFAAFGLGKSFMQLECMRLVGEREGGRQLIIAPLGVRQEFKIDAEKLGIKIEFVKWSKDIGGDGIYITNYESVRDGRLDVNLFNAVSLDEASCLRSYGSLTFQTFLTLFQAVKYRFVATATPSPNRFKELIHYAGFLGVMDTGQALTRFFKRDSTKANQLTIYPHKEKEFWLWISSWAIFLQRPSDLGYSDAGYDLPQLHVHYHEVKADSAPQVDRDGQIAMFNDASISLKAASKEKRESINERIEKMMEIIGDDPDSHYLLWHDQEAERHAIKKALPAAVEVYGSQDLELREERIIGFSNGEFKYLATKPVLSGSGCNFQRYCHNSIFLGIGFKFNDFIQAIHRVFRFLQTKEVHIHIIYADTEIGILEVLERKWKQHEEMVAKMTEIIKKYGLSHKEMENELRRSIGIERVEIVGKKYTIVNNDCVDECAGMESNSVGLIHTSIPFANHYEYTPSYNDFGHTESNAHFWEQMDFLTPNLFRILQPGRIAAIHIKDRILFGNVTGLGFPTCDNMLEETSMHFQKHGFKKIGIITVVTDVVRENNQTYRLGWTENGKDGSKMGVGCPEYILLFRKPQTDLTRGYADDPVTKSKDKYTRARWQVDAHAFWRSSGERLLTTDELASYGPDRLASLFTKQSLLKVYDYEAHVRIGEALELKGALPSTFMAIAPGSHHPQVWHDVNRMLSFNGNQTRRKLQLHICPLQFDIVDRVIVRYSNEGDMVFDPFGGLGTVPARAVKLGRLGYSCELNPESFKDSIAYLYNAECEIESPTLFNMEEGEKAA
jgi:DNA modification methylase